MIRGERVLQGVGNGEVEDTDPFVIRCEYVAEERERMMKGWKDMK